MAAGQRTLSAADDADPAGLYTNWPAHLFFRRSALGRSPAPLPGPLVWHARGSGSHTRKKTYCH